MSATWVAVKDDLDIRQSLTLMKQNRTFVVLVVVWFALLGSLPAFAEADPVDIEAMQAVSQRLSKADSLIASVDSIREWDRDGLNTRIDQLGVEVMRALNALAPRLLTASAVDEPSRTELLSLLDRAAAMAMLREAKLEERAAAERQLIDKFEQSAQADIARAFIEDLNQMRMDYLAELVKQAEIRKAAGLETDTLLRHAKDRVSPLVERLTGQIRLDAMSIDEIRLRLASEPLDEELEKALELVRIKQDRKVNDLEQVLEIARELGIETAEQSGLIIRERGQLGIEILQRDVFSTLWNEQLRRLGQDVTRHGPNVLFRVLLFILAILTAWVVSRMIRYPVQKVVNRDGFGLRRRL